MRVTLAKSPSKGDMKPKLDISCNQTSLPKEGLEHQHSHMHFEQQFILPKRWVGIRVAEKLWEGSTNDWSRLRPMPREGAHS